MAAVNERRERYEASCSTASFNRRIVDRCAPRPGIHLCKSALDERDRSVQAAMRNEVGNSCDRFLEGAQGTSGVCGRTKTLPGAIRAQ